MRAVPLTFPLPASAAAAVEVVAKLRSAGHRAYLVGGAVRDLLLGLPPGDWDVATDAAPARVQALFPQTHAVGAAYGVIIVVLRGTSVETATFREDGEYADGRRPERVRLIDDLERDASRRDFTVNALYLDPAAGSVLDPVGGADDCRRRCLRAVGDPAARLREDALRLLRAPRLAAQCGLTIEAATLQAVKAQRERIALVAAERVGREISAMLTGPAPAVALQLLATTGLLALVLPEAEALRGLPQPPLYHPEGDVWTHVLLMFSHSPTRSLPLGLAILLHDIAKPATMTVTDRIRFHGHERLGAQMTREIGARLRLPRRDVEIAAELVGQHLRFAHVLRMRPATLKRFLRQPHIRELLELHRLDCLGSRRDLERHAFCLAALARWESEQLAPSPLLRGADLLALGYRPGPQIGRLLRALETEQLEGRLSDRAAALAWLRERHPPATPAAQ